MAYQVRLMQEAQDHLRALPARQQRLVRDAIRASLVQQPTVTTRNRFPMGPNPVAGWELRVQALRVYYDVEGDEVLVRAVGVKRGNRVFIGGEEADLRGKAT
jgi:mRNA-degrading endonuclease RelE of RelBE toxin-antitoxin system